MVVCFAGDAGWCWRHLLFLQPPKFMQLHGRIVMHCMARCHTTAM